MEKFIFFPIINILLALILQQNYEDEIIDVEKKN